MITTIELVIVTLRDNDEGIDDDYDSLWGRICSR